MTAPSRSCIACSGVCLGGSADELIWEWYSGRQLMNSSGKGIPEDMSLLTDSQISEELATVPAWTRDGDSITTVTERADFRDALLYVGAVAYLAETANHHPDVTIAWNKVTLTLSTHSAGGLTASDFALARQISAL